MSREGASTLSRFHLIMKFFISYVCLNALVIRHFFLQKWYVWKKCSLSALEQMCCLESSGPTSKFFLGQA